LLTLAFPVAYLAGVGVQSLDWEQLKRTIFRPSLIALIYVGNSAFFDWLEDYRWGLLKWWPSTKAWGYWIYVTGCTLGLSFLLCKPEYVRNSLKSIRLESRDLTYLCKCIFVCLLTGDLLLIAQMYGQMCATQSIDRVYPQPEIINYVRVNNPEGLRTFDESRLFGPGSPSASVYGVPCITGYNPLDVARYRQFLAFITDDGTSQSAFSGEFTHPVVGDFSSKNPALLNLLGVRYRIDAYDPEYKGTLTAGWKKIDYPGLGNPVRNYSFLGEGLGLFNLHKYELLENMEVQPRAFVVTSANTQANADPDVLAQLKALDLRTAATLEDWNPTTDPLPTGMPGPATIRAHSPNRIAIDLGGQTAGLLVLTDPWYPGWVCRIDGQETKIWKADYAFRGVMVPAGSREVVFHFEPQSYRRGKWISLATLIGIAAFFGAARMRRMLARSG
jgi:hypothetical protein